MNVAWSHLYVICETVYIICFVILVLWMVNRTALMMIIDKKNSRQWIAKSRRGSAVMLECGVHLGLSVTWDIWVQQMLHPSSFCSWRRNSRGVSSWGWKTSRTSLNRRGMSWQLGGTNAMSSKRTGWGSDHSQKVYKAIWELSHVRQ